jgi:DNA-binding transcriptional regulator YiaG
VGEQKAMQYRVYIWSDPPQRLPRDFTNRSWPQFAKTRQKIVTIAFEDTRWIVSGHPDYVQFDAAGRWDRTYSAQGAMALLEVADRGRGISVPRIDEIRNAQRTRDAHLWKLSRADEALITADLTGESRIPFLKVTSPPTPKWSADRFRAGLRTLDLSQKELAKRLGIDLRTINRWATGKLPVPQYAIAYIELLDEKQG